MRLGRGAGVMLPTNLAVLARTAAIAEQVLRGLDQKMTMIEAVAHADAEFLSKVFVTRPDRGGLTRLKSEAATTAQSLPALAADWLQRARHEGGGIPVTLRADSLAATGRSAVRGTDRLALALVALGLYIAASLLMQHSIGPRVFGGWPLFAVVGYILALWFTVRIVRGIGADERDAPARRNSS
jgi:ubiquinone biosynthesis protein